MEKTIRELEYLLNEVKLISKKSGKKLLKYQKKLSSLTIDLKEAEGVVSEADIETEKYIIKNLKKLIPEAEFLAEESAYKKFGSEKEIFNQFQDKNWVWVIDPLDGTHNFLNGMDYFAICIGLLYKGEVVLGVVSRPRTEQVYYSIKGQGSFIENKSLRAKRIYQDKNKKDLKSSLLVTGFATEKGAIREIEFDLFRKVMERCRGVRRMGSAALDLCLVSEGVFDGFWERELAPWDVAAAALICLESGVRVTSFEGEYFNAFQSTIMAARIPLYKELSPLL